MEIKEGVNNVHEGKRSHKCSYCEKSFTEKGHLSEHIQVVHEGNTSSHLEFL